MISESLRHYLNEIEIYPSEERFTSFIDKVRVCLNQNYRHDIRDQAFEQIVKEVRSFTPDIFLIDHVLVGCHRSDTGLDLARRLRARDFDQPFIFLSRTLESSEKVMNKLPLVTGQKTWIPKGYAGKEILELEFFREKVVKQIERFLPSVKKESVTHYMQIFYGLLKELDLAHPDKLENISALKTRFDHTEEKRVEELQSKLEQLRAIYDKHRESIEARTVHSKLELAKGLIRDLYKLCEKGK